MINIQNCVSSNNINSCVTYYFNTIHILFFRRGLTPPHRVKSISMATFSTEEIDFIKSRGNEVC